MSNYLVNAAWEQREGRSMCRWFISWKSIENNQLAGAIAGYTGGGSFMIERFYATHDNSVITALWIDGNDRVSEDEIDFDSLDETVQQIANDAEDEIYIWNNQELWFDDEQLVLLDEKKSECVAEDDMLYLRHATMPLLHDICELAGLTAGPN